MAENSILAQHITLSNDQAFALGTKYSHGCPVYICLEADDPSGSILSTHGTVTSTILQMFGGLGSCSHNQIYYTVDLAVSDVNVEVDVNAPSAGKDKGADADSDAATASAKRTSIKVSEDKLRFRTGCPVTVTIAAIEGVGKGMNMNVNKNYHSQPGIIRGICDISRLRQVTSGKQIVKEELQPDSFLYSVELLNGNGNENENEKGYARIVHNVRGSMVKYRPHSHSHSPKSVKYCKSVKTCKEAMGEESSPSPPPPCPDFPRPVPVKTSPGRSLKTTTSVDADVDDGREDAHASSDMSTSSDEQNASEMQPQQQMDIDEHVDVHVHENTSAVEDMNVSNEDSDDETTKASSVVDHAGNGNGNGNDNSALSVKTEPDPDPDECYSSQDNIPDSMSHVPQHDAPSEKGSDPDPARYVSKSKGATSSSSGTNVNNSKKNNKKPSAKTKIPTKTNAKSKSKPGTVPSKVPRKRQRPAPTPATNTSSMPMMSIPKRSRTETLMTTTLSNPQIQAQAQGKKNMIMRRASAPAKSSSTLLAPNIQGGKGGIVRRASAPAANVQGATGTIGRRASTGTVSTTSSRLIKISQKSTAATKTLPNVAPKIKEETGRSKQPGNTALIDSKIKTGVKKNSSFLTDVTPIPDIKPAVPANKIPRRKRTSELLRPSLVSNPPPAAKLPPAPTPKMSKKSASSNPFGSVTSHSSSNWIPRNEGRGGWGYLWEVVVPKSKPFNARNAANLREELYREYQIFSLSLTCQSYYFVPMTNIFI